jgi:tetratricopeptide (TPR) repeat protein
MDIDGIRPGADFVKTIETKVSECDVLVAVIGERWISSSDGQGSRRLDNPEDFVRMEIATALKREIWVIPVLVDGASIPRSPDLPDDLKPLARRNALRVSDTGFNDDCRRLVTAIEEVLEQNAAELRGRDERERLEAEQSAKLAAEQRQNELLDAQRREKERLAVEFRQRQEKERLSLGQFDERSQSKEKKGTSVAASDQKMFDRSNDVPDKLGGKARSFLSRPIILIGGPIVIVCFVLFFGRHPTATPTLTPTPIPAATAIPTATATPTPESSPSPGLSYEGLINLAKSYLDAREYNSAITAYTEAIDVDRDNPEAYNLRGYAHRQILQYTQAISDYTEAIRLNPNDASAYYNRGFSYKVKETLSKRKPILPKLTSLTDVRIESFLRRWGKASASEEVSMTQPRPKT